MRARYVLVGNSAAALAAMGEIRKRDAAGKIVVVCREAGPAYSRVALPYYVAGKIGLDALWIRTREDYAAAGAELLEAAEASGIDVPERQLWLGDGRAVEFDRLLIATGSECIVPSIPGLGEVEFHSLWTLADAMRMKAAAERSRSAVIVGGGFIGMLVAEALRKLELRLTVVEVTDQLLPQLLDREAAQRFLDAVAAAGVTVRLASRVTGVTAAGGKVEVYLDSGGSLDGDMLVVAVGVRPNLGPARGGAVASARGILVDAELQTSVPGIYAAGDVAEVVDFLAGERVLHAIWPAAVEQGRAAGANMAGGCMRYSGSLGMNVVELFGVTLAQLGRFREGPGDQAVVLGGRGRGDAYRKIVVDARGRIVGAMYAGDGSGVAEMGVVHGLIRRGASWKEFSQYGLPRVTYAATLHSARTLEP